MLLNSTFLPKKFKIGKIFVRALRLWQINQLFIFMRKYIKRFKKHAFWKYREKKRLPCFQRDSGKDEQKTLLRRHPFPFLVEKIISMNKQYRKKYKKDSMFISTPSFDPPLLLLFHKQHVQNNKEKDDEEKFFPNLFSRW